jgi:hypothetical protein
MRCGSQAKPCPVHGASGCEWIVAQENERVKYGIENLISYHFRFPLIILFDADGRRIARSRDTEPDCNFTQYN